MYEIALKLFVKNAANSKLSLLFFLLFSWAIVGLNFLPNSDVEYQYEGRVRVQYPIEHHILLQYLPVGFFFSQGGSLLTVTSSVPLTVEQVANELAVAAKASTEIALENARVRSISEANTFDELQRDFAGREELLKMLVPNLHKKMSEFRTALGLLKDRPAEDLVFLPTGLMVKKKPNVTKSILQIVITLIIASITAIFVWCVLLLFKVVYEIEFHNKNKGI